MKSIVVTEFVKDLSLLHVTTHPSPTPPLAVNCVTIAIKSAALNYVDILYSRGQHQNNTSLVKPPFTLGLEFSGVVTSSPPFCPWPPGTAVFGESLGSFSTHLVLPFGPELFSSLHKVPPGWTWGQAASIPATMTVAYGALVLRGELKEGETVLVHGAAGGLGVMAVQIALAKGAGRVYATARGARKGEVVKGLERLREEYKGRVKVFDTAKEGKWWETILQETGGKGVDVVFDGVGMVDQSLKSLAHRGRVLVVGFAGRDAGSMEAVKMNRVLLKQAVLIGYRYGESSRRYPGEKEQIWRELWPLIEEGKIRPVVYDEVYKGLESVPRALKDLEERKVWGKAVVTVDNDQDMPKVKAARL
ncbi:quinone oxidoreductase [Coniochaeta sp. 2T2.1]|nr:quinone oxidoreductase [Coniochaeta sp. 2T2.1]